MMTHRRLIDDLLARIRDNPRLLDRPVVLSVRDGAGEVHAGSVEAVLLSEVIILRMPSAALDDWADDTIVQPMEDMDDVAGSSDFSVSADRTVVCYGLPLSPRLPG